MHTPKIFVEYIIKDIWNQNQEGIFIFVCQNYIPTTHICLKKRDAWYVIQHMVVCR